MLMVSQPYPRRRSWFLPPRTAQTTANTTTETPRLRQMVPRRKKSWGPRLGHLLDRREVGDQRPGCVLVMDGAVLGWVVVQWQAG